jgi:hypothetical protein
MALLLWVWDQILTSKSGILECALFQCPPFLVSTSKPITVTDLSLEFVRPSLHQTAGEVIDQEAMEINCISRSPDHCAVRSAAPHLSPLHNMSLQEPNSSCERSRR